MKTGCLYTRVSKQLIELLTQRIERREMMKTKKTVKPVMAMVTALFLLGSFSAQAGSVQIVPTTASSSIVGCVSTGTLCGGRELLDDADDTIELFEIAPDVTGFIVEVQFPSDDTGSANVLLNGGLVDALSTANPLVFAAINPSVNQVIEILNTDATRLNYLFSPTDAVVPVPAAVWLFGSGLLGLVGVARRRRGLSAA
jgi:hypothetical protein